MEVSSRFYAFPFFFLPFLSAILQHLSGLSLAEVGGSGLRLRRYIYQLPVLCNGSSVAARTNQHLRTLE